VNVILSSCHATFANEFAEHQPRVESYTNDFRRDRGSRQGDADVGGYSRDVLTGLGKRSLNVSTHVLPYFLHFHKSAG
jgi:hypothetical protein